MARQQNPQDSDKAPAGSKGRPKIGSQQINTRVSLSLLRELEYVAEGLGLDVSSFIRMLITENIHVYRARVDQRPSSHDPLSEDDN